ncbi:retrovirus-related pol polyprotein from transposon TNT 1-94 [Tanacetum coccineum]
MGTVHFGNDNFEAIIGYGDYIQGNINICHVYYVEGLGHNLFSVGQFCDGDLEGAFRSKKCYVRNLKGATSTKSWLWHRRFSHLNFGTINNLTRLDLVDGLPKFKYEKEHLCSACERGKSKKASYLPKLVPSDHSKLELLHMDLCRPMRIIKEFIAQGQLNYKAKVCKIRTDNGTEFKNATLKAHYEKLGIMQQFSTARTLRMIGGLMYLTASRPDIAFATFVCARYQARPTIKHLKEHSGGLQFLGGKLMSLSSKKQDYTAMSTAEAEYVSLSACCAQVIWMRTQLLDYGYKYNRIPMYCDSKSAIAISCNPVQHSKRKHIDIRYHFIKEHVEKGTVEIYFVGTEYQLADLFTKALPKERFEYLVHCIGMRCMTPTQLESLTKSSS